MESKLARTIVKRYGDGTQEACILGEPGAFSCRNTLWGFQVWKPPKQFLVVWHPYWCLLYMHCGTVSRGKWPSVVWTWKSLEDNTESKSDRRLQNFEESEVHVKGFLTPDLGGTETPKNSERTILGFCCQPLGSRALEIIMSSTIRRKPF